MDTKIKIGGVCERDLDLFLQEQFLSSPDFCRWFAEEKLGIGEISDVAIDVERGQTDQTGESDVKAKFRLTSGSTLTIFIENKIKAGFQNGQYARYEQRAQREIDKGETDAYRIVLFAPQKYLDRKSLEGFDSANCTRVSYDDVMDYFKTRCPDTSLCVPSRDAYKATLVREAIRAASGDNQAVSEDFWRRYWEEVNAIATEFNFPYPSGRKSAGGDTIEFTRSALKEFDWPINPQPCHRLAQGNFGEFGKGAFGAFYIKIPTYFAIDKFGALVDTIEPLLEPHMLIVKSKPSAAIRIAVPQIRKSNWTKDQVPALRTAIYLGKNLYDWFLSERVQAAWSDLMNRHRLNE